MNVLMVAALTLAGLAGTAVVAANMPERQAVTLSFFGIALTVLFMAFQAPDVALSQLGVGAAIVPLMVMLAIRTISGRRAREAAEEEQAGSGEDEADQEEVLPGRGGDRR
jgi:energy-converting hydrogenase B subunit D